MPQGFPAADSGLPVTTPRIEAATTLLGARPAFWGRYFTSVGTTESVQYCAEENGPLNAAGIRLLPIGWQTEKVNGSETQGVSDGSNNAQSFIATFGASFLASQGGKFYLFLDVEGSPSLSSAYYTGWAQGLAQQSAAMCQSAGLASDAVQLLPCVYGTQGDTETWSALASATSANAPCMGVWIARYDPNDCQLADWSAVKVTPVSPKPFPFTILAWQLSGNCLSGQIDISQINPSLDPQSDLLDFLVLPPPPAAAT